MPSPSSSRPEDVSAGPDVRIVEVGPRDGLQSVAAIMPTKKKQAWIQALVATGLREIEVGSFVPASVLPQLADTAEIVRFARQFRGVRITALVPNLRGAEAAFESGVHAITIPVSASEAHSLANVRRSRDEMVTEVQSIVKLRDDRFSGIDVEVAVATAFGCTLSGVVPDDDVVRLSTAAARAGANRVGLSDTAGVANPTQVRRLFRRVRNELGPQRCGGAHFHDTLGFGLANVVAALEEGIDEFDASQRGLGGCPFAPAAAGNIATEDLVLLLETMGRRTRIDYAALVAAGDLLAESLPGAPFRSRPGALEILQRFPQFTGPKAQ